ncbi:Jag N-terminal domain-containing protein [Campylobacter sp. MOP7]|uniref:Jag N-terminal domain-containing protein n=1 Tax=Campylobacter canis TaxID=3378588 RepID=UPI00387ED469
MRIEAKTLQEAFRKAAEELNCSVTELDIKVIQNPSMGFLGFFKKTAIIEAERENDKPKNGSKKHRDKKERSAHEEHKSKNSNGSNNSNGSEKHKDEKSAQKAENHSDKQNGSSDKKRRDRNKKRKEKRNGENLSLNGENGSANKTEKDQKSDTASALNQNFDISHNAFKSDEAVESEPLNLEIQSDEITEIKEPKVKKEESKSILDTSIIDTFNKDIKDDEQKIESKQKEQKPRADIQKVLPEIKDGLDRLFAASCFDISKIEVDKFDDETVLIKLDGEDAALLIGKEGYRYKAISYLIYNWINSKYNLLVRLEIAEFLKNQEDAIEQYLVSVIEKVQSTGKAKTKPLDGILVKIALEKLREKFPNKYVAVKSDHGKQFIVINDFAKKHE